MSFQNEKGLGIWRFYYESGRLKQEIKWDDVEHTKFHMICWDEEGNEIECKR